MTFQSILTTLLILFIIRASTIAGCFGTSFESLWRPGLIFNFPPFFKYVLAALGIFATYKFVKALKNCSYKIKNAYFIYFAVLYLFSALFQRKVVEYYSYLYTAKYYNLSLSDFWIFFSEDLFFDVPYIFWNLLLMAFIYFIFHRAKHEEYSIPFWIIPFSFIDLPLNNIQIALGIGSFSVAILGLRQKNNHSAVWYYLLQFIISTYIAYYSSYTIPENSFCLSLGIPILTMFYLPGFILVALCIANSEKNSLKTTWMLPAITNILIMLPLTRMPSNLCFPNTIAFISSFLFTGNIAISVSLVILISYLLIKITPKLGRIAFRLLSGLTIAYYGLDALLYYYSRFRLNYQTLLWTLNMNKVETTFKTCFAYISFESWLLIGLFVIFVLYLYKSSNKIFTKENAFSVTLCSILLSGQLAASLMVISEAYPIILRDPFSEMMKTLPIFAKSKTDLSLAQIKEGFRYCKTPIKEYEPRESVPGNGNNLILITLESVHWRYVDMFGKGIKTWPELSKLKDRIEIFPFFFSCYPESTTADMAVVTGLQAPSHLYIEQKDIMPCSSITDELKKAGYETYMFSIGNVSDGNLISIVKAMPFDHFWGYSSDNPKPGYKVWRWGYEEEDAVKEVLEQLEAKKSDVPYFIWYRGMCPHAPFPPLGEQTENPFKQTNPLKPDLTISYKNNLFYLDKQLARLVEGIDKLDKERNQNTVIALVADHGEMLGEDDNSGLNGHGPYAAAKLTNTVFVIIRSDSNGLKVNTNPGSQIDVIPTLLDCLELQPSVKRVEQGYSLLKKDFPKRPVYLNSIESYAIAEDDYYFSYSDKNSSEAVVRKMNLTEDYKATFDRVASWPADDLEERYKRVKKYFELQSAFLDSFY